MATPHETEAAPAEASDPAANRATYLGFLVWVAGFLFLLFLMLADLVIGLVFRG